MAATARFQPHSTTTTPIRGNKASSAAQIRNDEASSSGSSRIYTSTPTECNTKRNSGYQQTLEKIENEQALLKKAFEESMKDSFSINSSSFKVHNYKSIVVSIMMCFCFLQDDLMEKIANLFCNMLSRQPEQKDVLVSYYTDDIELLQAVLLKANKEKANLLCQLDVCNKRLREV